MNNERTIAVPANATAVTFTFGTPTAEGETETKIIAGKRGPQVVIERKADGLTPLRRVRYTSNAGNTETYGVFWEGMKNGVHRVGLKPLLKSGLRMVKRNRYSKASGGFFVDASLTSRVS